MSFKQFFGPARMAVKEAVAYKLDFAIWTIILPINFIVFYFLWQAVFAHSGVQLIRGMSFHDLVLYYALAMVFNTFNYAGVTEELAERIRRGKFVVNAVQPMNVVLRYLSQHLGVKLMSLVLEVLPLAVLVILFIKPTAIPINFLIFCVSVGLATVIAYLLRMSIGLLAFWLKQVEGITIAFDGMSSILRGTLVPLAFFPVAIQGMLNYLPFPYLVYQPIQIFLGKLSLIGSVGILGVQLVWIMLLYLLNQVILHAGLKSFTGAGT